MATHDYVIDNQTAPNFRADLNNALLAIVSNNSSATAPTVTYANMMWYDTAANILYMRNEDNDAWIALGTLDQTADTFAASVALASQAEAEAGTDNTKVMTPLRVAQVRGFQTPNSSTVGQGVSVQNTRGKPIHIAAAVGPNNSSGQSTFQSQISANNSSWVVAGAGTTLQSNDNFGVSILVPASWYWRIVRVAGSNTAASVKFVESF